MLKLVGASSVSLILWSHSQARVKALASLSEKSAACSLNSSGRMMAAFLCSSTYLCAISVTVLV